MHITIDEAALKNLFHILGTDRAFQLPNQDAELDFHDRSKLLWQQYEVFQRYLFESSSSYVKVPGAELLDQSWDNPKQLFKMAGRVETAAEIINHAKADPQFKTMFFNLAGAVVTGEALLEQAKKDINAFRAKKFILEGGEELTGAQLQQEATTNLANFATTIFRLAPTVVKGSELLRLAQEDKNAVFSFQGEIVSGSTLIEKAKESENAFEKMKLELPGGGIKGSDLSQQALDGVYDYVVEKGATITGAQLIRQSREDKEFGNKKFYFETGVMRGSQLLAEAEENPNAFNKKKFKHEDKEWSRKDVIAYKKNDKNFDQAVLEIVKRWRTGKSLLTEALENLDIFTEKSFDFISGPLLGAELWVMATKSEAEFCKKEFEYKQIVTGGDKLRGALRVELPKQESRDHKHKLWAQELSRDYLIHWLFSFAIRRLWNETTSSALVEALRDFVGKMSHITVLQSRFFLSKFVQDFIISTDNLKLILEFIANYQHYDKFIDLAMKKIHNAEEFEALITFIKGIPETHKDLLSNMIFLADLDFTFKHIDDVYSVLDACFKTNFGKLDEKKLRRLMPGYQEKNQKLSPGRSHNTTVAARHSIALGSEISGVLLPGMAEEPLESAPVVQTHTPVKSHHTGSRSLDNRGLDTIPSIASRKETPFWRRLLMCGGGQKTQTDTPESGEKYQINPQ